VTGDVYAMKKIKKSIENAAQIKEERNIMSNAAMLGWITTLHFAFQVSANFQGQSSPAALPSSAAGRYESWSIRE
jgi:hypothetical protein